MFFVGRSESIQILRFARFPEGANDRNMETVIQANELFDFQLKDPLVTCILDFSTSRFDNVVLFKPMPEFTRLYCLLSAYGAAFAETLEPDNDRTARCCVVAEPPAHRSKVAHFWSMTGCTCHLKKSRC